MHLKAILALFLALACLSLPAMAVETHTETLTYNQNYVASGVGSYTGSSTVEGVFGGAFRIDFDSMPTGESLWILQTNRIKNATLSQVSSSFTATYNGSVIGTGTVVLSNGTFSGYTHQVEFYWDYFQVPSYGVSGLQGITITHNLDAGQAGVVTFWTNEWRNIGVTGVPMGTGYAPGAYYFTAPVYFSVDYTFTKDDVGVYRFSLAKNGYQTKATVYSPSSTAAYSESTYNILDRTDQAFINGGTARGGICSAVAGGICLNTSWFFEPSYNMTLDQHTINQGGTTCAHITSSTGTYSLLNAYTLVLTPDSGGGTATVGGDNPTWILSSGHWYQWDDSAFTYTKDWGTSFPSTVCLGNFTAPGVYTVEASLFQTDNYGPPKMSDTVNVTGAGTYNTVTLKAVDASSGNLVYGALCSIKLASGIWSNQTQTSVANSWSIPSGSYIGYTASADGYEPMGVTYTQVTSDRVITVPLTTSYTTEAGNTSLVVWVRTPSGADWAPLSGAAVSVNGVTKTTGSSGIVTFEVLQSTTYSVSASKSGYNGVTRSVAVGTTQTSVSLELSPTTISPTTAVPTNSEGNPITTVPTIDTRTDAQKDADLMALVRSNGPQLVELFIMVTILYLLGVRFGGK